MSLVPVDTSSAVAVSDYLTKARDWLSTAVEMTGPEQIAAAKAEIATAAEATKQLGLSKEIQLDAQEMVRRAEYALGKAIRKGQAEGVVETVAEARYRATLTREVNQGRADQNSLNGLIKARPSDFATAAELSGQTGRNDGIYGMSDEVEPSEFEHALVSAKAEGNLSRANVVRKVKGEAFSGEKLSGEQRGAQIAELAEHGWTSQQIALEVGISAERVRQVARNQGVAIRADEVRRGRRHLNHDRVLDNVTESLEVAAIALRDIDPDQLDKEETAERLDSLTTSIKALSKAVQKIKESFHD